MTTPFDRCRCDDVDHLEDDDAIAYSQGHLRLQHVAGDAWSSDWRCPVTGACWMERYHLAWRPGNRYVSLDRVAAQPASPSRTTTPAADQVSVPAPAARMLATAPRRVVVLGTAVALAGLAASGLFA